MDQTNDPDQASSPAAWALVYSSLVTAVFVSVTVMQDPIQARLWLVMLIDHFC